MRTVALFALLTLMLGVQAQEAEEEQRGGAEAPHSASSEVPEWVRLMNSEDPDVLRVIGAYEAYYREHRFEKNSDTQNYKRFVREAIHDPEPRDPVARDDYRQGLRDYMDASEQLLAERSVNWTCIGPFDYDNTAAAKSYGQGSAHVYTVEQSTVNPNLLYAGTATAGVWKSTDKGLNWTNVTKNLMGKFVQAVELDPVNQNVAYAGLRADLMKTTDGGVTWNEVGGPTFVDSASREILDIVVRPGNSNLVLAACSDGLWYSNNGGSTFTLKLPGYFQEIELCPSAPDSVYVVKRDVFTNTAKTKTWYRMRFLSGTAFGNGTWVNFPIGWPIPPVADSTTTMLRAELAVSPAAPRTIYALITGTANGGSGLFGVYKSVDRGVNFTFQCCGTGPGGVPSPTNLNPMGYATDGTGDGGQEGYNVAFCVDPANVNKLHLGGIMRWVSTDGGVSFTCPNSWDNSGGASYIHADVQDIRQYGNDLWVACDGGIYYSTDGGTTFNKRMNGIAGTTFWGFGAGGWTGAQVMGGGTYHNGTLLKDNSVYTTGWVSTDGGDNNRSMVHPQDDRRMLTDYGYKVLSGNRTVNNVNLPWSSMPNASPEPGRNSEVAWHPNLAFTGYFGKDDKLMRTDDNGATFTEVRAFGGLKRVTNVQVAFSAPEHLYVCVETVGLPGDPPAEIWHSADGGQNWNAITPSAADLAPDANLFVPWDIAVSETAPLTIWAARVSAGEAVDGKMVFKSTNGGSSWTNITSNVLDNETPTNIIRARGTADGIYLGTRRAVYYHSTATSGWVLRNAGLPFSTFSTSLKINYRLGKIRNATDHSVWESDLETPSSPVANFCAITREPACGTPVQFYDNSVLSENGAFWEWYFPGGDPQYSYERNPVVTFAGYEPFDVTLTVTDANGTSTRTIDDFITPAATDTAPPILEHGESQLDVPWAWRVENPDQAVTWDNVGPLQDPTYPAGHAYKINYYLYNAPGQEDRLITPTINLAGNANSRLKFYHAYAPYGQGYDDGLRVEITSVCGAFWNTIYTATGAALGTAPVTTEPWTPLLQSHWQLHDIDLSMYDGQRIAIRFIGINGWGNNLYLDDIQIETSGVAIDVSVALEGAMIPALGLMRDDLRVAGLLPSFEPYTGLGFTSYPFGGESLFPLVLNRTGDQAPVDWVLVELRSEANPSVIVDSHAGLVTRDLHVVGNDGISPLSFRAAPGNYYVSVRHRNHLGCMTATPLALGSANVNIVQFTDPALTTYGTNARKDVDGGTIKALWMGNVVNNGNLKYAGSGNDRDPILVRVGGLVPTSTVVGYHVEDCNLNGVVKYAGSANDRDPILVNIGGTVPTSVRTEQVP
ncbi:MAG: choice-of-anchor J domain-containing protein [Flavobacteriales bacterium]|nr:choice-of-anchor J domain-containing protein [Flavobacteriales bacterium]